MIVRPYTTLSAHERAHVRDVLGHDEGVLTGPHFEDGRTMLIAWQDDAPVGALAVITREAARNGQIFATKAASFHDDAPAALIDAAVALGREAGGRCLMLGVRPEVRWPLVGFERAYDSLELAYPIDRPVAASELALVDVEDTTAEAYRDVINAAFADSPNGSTETAADIARQRAAPGAQVLLSHLHGRPAVGAYVLMNDGDYVIDALGVVPGARGMGLGKALVRALVKRGQEQGAKRISLMVIDANARALRIYLREGFEQQRVVTHWFRRTL